MMKCEEALYFVDAWESGAKTLGDLERFRAHLDGCRECSRRFGALLPLMARDAGASGIAAAASAAPAAGAAPADFADGVMEALDKKNRHTFAFNPLLAAAAAAIFVVGLSLGIFFAKTNSGFVTVRFSFVAPQANSVYLAGDFNAWGGKDYALRRTSPDSPWEISVKLRKGQIYVYNFVVNGNAWVADPSVDARIDDGFGGSGSLLRL